MHDCAYIHIGCTYVHTHTDRTDSHGFIEMQTPTAENRQSKANNVCLNLKSRRCMGIVPAQI